MAAKEHVQSLPEFDSLGYVALTPLKDSSPPSRRAARFQTKDGPPEDKSESLDPKIKGKFYSESDRRQRLAVEKPKSSGWATLYRVCGWLWLVVGIIGTIGNAQEDGEAGFTFAVIAIAAVLACFLSAFLIDVLTDIRHYQKQSAECLQKLIEKG